MYSVVVPVYQSAEILPELIAELEPVLRELDRPFEVILVNDGSPDGSWGVIARLASTHDWIRPIDMMRNYGQHNALLCGIRAARGDVTITLDDDLQHPPNEIPTLLAKLAEGHDVVYGMPQREPHGVFRGLASRLVKLGLKVSMGAETARMVSAFRAFRTELRDSFARYHSPYVSIDVLLTWGTSKFAGVQVRHDARRRGASGYTIRKLVVHTLNMTTGFSTVPLRLASYMGFFFTLFGLGVLGWAVGRYLYLGGTTAPGFPFLASVIAIFSGAQLFALGIIGEYLARMHYRTMEKPPYTVREHAAQPAPRPADEKPVSP
jgi:undecaprenyl-phosphate 4-deoxy-4-formamido-L-arabinose transferase